MTLGAAATSSSCLAVYDHALAREPVNVARDALLHALAGAPEQTWLDCGRTLVLRPDLDTASEVFRHAAQLYPASADFCIGLAGLRWQLGMQAEAESLLRDWLSRHAADVGASLLLARLLFDQGRVRAAATVTRELFATGSQDIETVIRGVEMLDDFGCPREALAICESALARGVGDARLHAYAGMLGIQLGRFEDVRRHYASALDQTAEAVEWNIPIGLSGLQRYTDATHPDFAFFHALLEQPGLSNDARTTTSFALGKAYDDIGDHARAAQCFREGNARARTSRPWSRKQWNRLVGARSASTPFRWSLPAPADWTPIFIVGVPRSGTTLLAELIGRHPRVRNRGELGWLQGQVKRLASTPRENREAFAQAAATYAAHLRQDDADADWFIDKQPFNFLHVDLIMACWPNARIIHCQRNPRDVALSLWSHSFHDSAHNYAYDFADIAAVIRGCGRLMEHWRVSYPASIFPVPYEELVENPEAWLGQVSRWIGLPDSSVAAPLGDGEHAISTASAWQARQPIHTRSVGHWKNYATHVPELLRFPPS